MNQWLGACLVVLMAGCSSGTGAGGGSGGGATGGGAAGGGTGGGSGGGAAGGGTGGGIVDAGVPIPTPLIGLSAGADITCAVLASKTARCWGRNNAGQLGDGSTTDSVKPVTVLGLTNVASISAGYEHACAVLDDGTARCWGSNTNGQLGNNSTTGSNSPVVVSGLSNVTQIAAGVSISCARTTTAPPDGGTGTSVYCWGRGGELGDGTVTQSIIPRRVPNLDNVTQLSLAPNSGTSTTIHACGVRSTGAAFCWGSNSSGELGDGTQNPSRVPVAVLGITDATEVTAGGSHACAKRPSGLVCWGFGQQIGDGQNMQRLVPTAVSTTATITSIEAGADHTLARTSTNGLLCWGRSSRGQCGDGAAFPASGPIYLTPVASSLTGVTLFSSGNYHSCGFVGATNVTWCWGSNDWGEVGYGTPGQPSRTSVPDFVRW